MSPPADIPIQSILATIHALQPLSIAPRSMPVSWMTSYSTDQSLRRAKMAKAQLRSPDQTEPACRSLWNGRRGRLQQKAMRCDVHLGLRVGSQDVWHDCSDPVREIECLTLV